LREFGLWDARNLYPHHYSRGMRLKLGLLIALIRPFKVLLLDEPTSALDVESAGFLVRRLKELRQSGASILFSSHDPNISRELADRTLNIQNQFIEEI
jgi:ABC-2 type transport system ATP-binding protein